MVLLLSCRIQAFDFNYNSSGNPAHWAFPSPNASISTNVLNRTTHALRFFIALDGFSTTNTAAELNAVRNSFGEWQAIPNTIIKFEYGGLTGAATDVNTGDNTNVVYWTKTSTLVNGGHDDIGGALGVTFSSFTVPGNEILQSDIVLNAVDYGWFTDFTDQNNANFFIESVLCHEIGHQLGMAHAAIGGAAMLYAGDNGIGSQFGLTADEVSFARTVYPSGSILASLGNLKGQVTGNGVPLLGAVVVVEGTNGNLAGGTVTLTNGNYIMNALPPGSYNVRVVPLDPATNSTFLIKGISVANPNFSSAITSFLPTTNTPVTLSAGVTNSLNFAVTMAEPAFRISSIRQPTLDPNSYSIISLPISLRAGQSNYTIGALSPNLPTNNATITINGDGLTLGTSTFRAGPFAGLNTASILISVASNATPGLRSFLIQSGTNRAYANGYLRIRAPVPDYNFDGLDDVFQRKYFFPFTSASAAPGADPDLDGFSNYQEYIAGTTPTNAASVLKIQSVSATSSNSTVTWQSVAGKNYQLTVSTNLAKGLWQNVGGLKSSAGATTAVIDFTSPKGPRFYRVQALP